MACVEGYENSAWVHWEGQDWGMEDVQLDFPSNYTPELALSSFQDWASLVYPGRDTLVVSRKDHQVTTDLK